MRTIDVNGRDGTDFNAIFINALRQFWKNTKSFQCIGNPKNQNLLLYLNGCKITYNDKNGKVFVAQSGDLVYTPEGSEYTAWLSDFVSEESHTVGINFWLTDECGERVTLSDNIRIFHAGDTTELSSLIYRAEMGAHGQRLLESRIILLEILSRLMNGDERRDNSLVSEAVRYLSEHSDDNPGIAGLARHCGVSEVYLRRKFKEKMGTSPAKYRNELRLNKAKDYLRFGDISVQEISDTLGYSTASHFIKEFKERYGVSPLQYRKNKGEK